ncbi:MAG: protein kinase [Polyangiales bacterium]
MDPGDLSVDEGCRVSETTPLNWPPPPSLRHARCVLEAGTVLSDRFQVEAWVGSGGMGDVYRGRDLTTDAAVAIKVVARFDPEDAERFGREVVLLAGLSHPAIVRYVAHGATPSGNPFLIMAWLSGGDLATRLRNGPLTAAETWSLLERICSALEVAHGRAIVHRDLKPSNLILVDDDPARVVLLDFGVARSLRTQPLTNAGMVLGTVGYMAPEQALGEVELDARADVFALGCVLYECLTGQPAFGGRHTVAVLSRLLSGTVPRLEAHDPRLAPFDPLLGRLLARDKRDRPGDVAEVVDALARLWPLARKVGVRRVTPRAAVSERERRLVSVLLCQPAADAPFDDAVVAPIEQLVRSAFGVEPELRRAERGLLIVLSARGLVTDRAVESARLAAAIVRQAPRVRCAIATGFAQTGRQIAVGELVARAAGVLELSRGATGQCLVDQLTADLCRSHFELQPVGSHWLVGDAWPLDAPPRRLLRRVPPHVGRDKELALLEATYRECAQDRVVRSVVISAPRGTGKTRLASELVARVRARGPVRVLFARGDALADFATPSLVRQLIAAGLQLSDHADTADATEQQRRCRAVFGRSGSLPVDCEHGAFLAELLGVPLAPDHDDPSLRAARHDPALMSERKRRAFARFLLALATREPLLIVIDDLQWGDFASVDYLDDALREVGDRAVMMCALARPEAYERFPQLWADHDRQDIRLPRLTSRASEQLVRAVLGDDAARVSLPRIAELADGHPFYIEELLRHIARHGRDFRSLPPSLLALAQARLEQLPADTRRVLRAASVLGERCWPSAVRALVGAGVDVHAELERLTRHELLERGYESRFAGSEEYVLRHPLVREVAYTTLADDDRRAAHRAAGTWLVGRGERDPELLAHHFSLGGERRTAALWHARAVRPARVAGD